MADPQQTKSPNKVKELLGIIQSHQKALFLAALSTLLFAFAPLSNPLLREGRAELKALRAGGHEARARNLVEASSRGGTAVDRVLSEFRGRGFNGGKAAGAPQAALGIMPPRSLQDLVALVDGDTTYCVPRVEGRVVAGLSMLKKDGAPDGAVESLELRALHEDEAGPLARLVIDASIKLADHAPSKQPSASAGAPPSAVSLAGRPAESIVVLDQGRPREVPNPEFHRWRLAETAFKKAQTAQAKAAEARKAADAARTEASRILRDQMLALERATGAQLDRSAAARFVVATLKLKDVIDFEGQRLESLTIPMACEQRPLFENGEVKKELGLADSATILPALRVTPLWSSVRGLRADSAASVVEAELAKDKDMLEVAGLKIHQDLAVFAAPVAIAILALWVLFHAILLLRALGAEGAQEAWREAAVVPPHVPSLAALVATTAASAKLIERAQHPLVWASASSCFVAVLACTLVFLIVYVRTRPNPRATPG